MLIPYSASAILHSALLVGDDQELGTPSAVPRRCAASRCMFVSSRRGFDLVEHVERRGGGPLKMASRKAIAVSERSPPDSSDIRLTFLPGGRASKSMAGGQHVVGLGQDQPPLNRRGTAGRRSLRIPGRVSSKADANTSWTRSSTSLTTVQQVTAGLLEVLEAGWPGKRVAVLPGPRTPRGASGFTLPSWSSWRWAAAARRSCSVRTYGTVPVSTCCSSLGAGGGTRRLPSAPSAACCASSGPSMGSSEGSAVSGPLSGRCGGWRIGG